MTFTSADLRRFGLREQNGKAVRVETQKPRARRFTGKVAQYKAWLREMEQGPGVFVPVRVNNPLNNRKGWRTVWRASKLARGRTAELCKGRIPTTLPATVTLTRYSWGVLDDDGLAAALKPARDGVADVFGTDDSAKSGLTFRCRQEKSKHYGVRVEVVAA